MYFEDEDTDPSNFETEDRPAGARPCMAYHPWYACDKPGAATDKTANNTF